MVCHDCIADQRHWEGEDQRLPLCLPYYRHSAEVWKKNLDFKCNKYVHLLHKHEYILTGKIQIMQNNSEQIVWGVHWSVNLLKL